MVLSGDPFSVYTQVLETWVEGEKIFDRSDPQQRAYAVGGLDVYRSTTHLHMEGGGR